MTEQEAHDKAAEATRGNDDLELIPHITHTNGGHVTLPTVERVDGGFWVLAVVWVAEED